MQRCRLFALLALASAAGCAPEFEPSPAASAPPAEPVVPPVEPDAKLSEADKAELGEILEQAKRILVSPRFHANMAALGATVPWLWQSPFGGRLRTDAAARLIAGGDPRAVFLPTSVEWADTEDSRTAPDAKLDGRARIRLGTYVRDRWRLGTPISRSCAITTVTHEISHTLSSSPTQLDYVFTDWGVTFARIIGRPVVSYTIGSVAQCTYLQERDAGLDLASCVRTWGTNRFNSGSCEG